MPKDWIVWACALGALAMLVFLLTHSACAQTQCFTDCDDFGSCQTICYP